MNDLLNLMHDTWSPVNSIKRAAELIKEGKLNPEEVKKLCTLMIKKADQLNEVIDVYYKSQKETLIEKAKSDQNQVSSTDHKENPS